ncbi:hypothetical protein ACWGKW_18165, partial [Streptomyces sp. NPDC054766]
MALIEGAAGCGGGKSLLRNAVTERAAATGALRRAAGAGGRGPGPPRHRGPARSAPARPGATARTVEH